MQPMRGDYRRDTTTDRRLSLRRRSLRDHEGPHQRLCLHCTDCQRATVSVFSIGVAFPGEAFRLTGKELQPSPGGVTDAGRVNTRWVCPDCGICLCGGLKIGTEPPGYTRIVRGGTLDDTSWLNPTTHFYTRNKQPWVILPAGATIYETQPDRA
jgi:hypothetical protein